MGAVMKYVESFSGKSYAQNFIMGKVVKFTSLLNFVVSFKSFNRKPSQWNTIYSSQLLIAEFKLEQKFQVHNKNWNEISLSIKYITRPTLYME